MLLFALTIFLSAFLLFQVQPVMGRFVLPWFGGGPSVWTVCMLFFQMLLLGGYTYAHVIRTRLSQRGQALVHVALLAAAMLALRSGPSAAWKPTGEGDPTWQILWVLAATVGLPYLALAATGPLLQAWFSSAYPGRSPYRLYALSNVGSLLALVSYPFVVEPLLGLRTQCDMWGVGFGA
ncbi:ferrichrome ABC transporter permease, partial [bacterium]|nr:ferrichrome ABC transporter permease [bacterium]